MELLSATIINSLFSATYKSKFNVDFISEATLSRGMNAYQSGNYDISIADYKRVIGLDPDSDYAAKAYALLGTEYVQLNRTDNAIALYNEYIHSFPTNDDPHVQLGNIYFGQNRYEEAQKEYESAVNLNPQSVKNWYSLGQAYMATGNYDDAENAFKKTTHLSPEDYSGYHGLGQVCYKQGQYKEAINLFQKVSEMKMDFDYIHVDLGYAYADMGDFDNAKQQLKILNDADSSLANLLNSYIYKVLNPKFLAAYSSNGFNVTLGTATPLSSLDSSLSNAGASKDFTMNFIFSKGMDASSVRNPYNWKITRASAGTPGGAYNWGMSIPSTETQIALFPKYVLYDPDSLTATVTFQISQNALANGTIDPSHIMFKFSGIDAYGYSMDPAADEYGGLSVIV